MPKRCALGCPVDSRISYHQFPNLKKNPQGFKAWVHVAGGKLENDADYEFYRKKVICDVHFTAADWNRNNRLNFKAIPSLHLDMVPKDNVLSKEIPEIPGPTQPSTSLHNVIGEEAAAASEKAWSPTTLLERLAELGFPADTRLELPPTGCARYRELCYRAAHAHLPKELMPPKCACVNCARRRSTT